MIPRQKTFHIIKDFWIFYKIDIKPILVYIEKKLEGTVKTKVKNHPDSWGRINFSWNWRPRGTPSAICSNKFSKNPIEKKFCPLESQGPLHHHTIPWKELKD